MIGHFAEYYIEVNFVIDPDDRGTRLGSVLGELSDGSSKNDRGPDWSH